MIPGDYRKSLKMPEAEELFDLAAYRPLAYVLVQGLHRLPVTPNQVTVVSMLAGIAAAWCFGAGTHVAAVWGACWYFAANVLDCADGQLARLQNSGTLLGRVVDGVADYVSSVAIFLGIGLGFAAAGEAHWLLVVAGGLSSALHAMFFDHYQNEFIASARGNDNFVQNELDRFAAEIDMLRQARRGVARRLLLGLYVRYLSVQRRVGAGQGRRANDPQRYRREHTGMIRLWSFLGPTTNRTLLMVCALAGRIDLYLWIVAAAGNAWLMIAYLLERRIGRRRASPEAA